MECIVFLVKRKLAAASSGGDEEASSSHDDVKKLLTEQLERTWNEISSGKLRVENVASGKAIAKTLVSLEHIDEGKDFHDSLSGMTLTYSLKVISNPRGGPFHLL